MSGARLVIGRDELHAGVRRLAAEITAAHNDGVVLVAVLKGAVPFLADLVRQLGIVPLVDFLAISAYTPETGRVRIVKDLDIDVYDRNVILVEDIVDTGLTLTYLLGELRGRGARSVEACTLLDKSVRRIVPTPVHYTGFDIGDEFVIGYGLDYVGRYRNLDCILTGDLEVLQSDPDAYVAALFTR